MGLSRWFRRLRTDRLKSTEAASVDDPAAILRRARRLKFRVPRESLSELAGAYTTARPGMGLAFAELKPYEPGDDVRHMDWNVTARQERPYVRRFAEERSLTVWIALDISASLRFGPEGRSKADRATQAAALLATAAIRAGDRVGLLLVSDHIEGELEVGTGPRHLARLLRMLVAAPAHSVHSSFATVPCRIRAASRRALIVLLSDFLFESPEPTLPWAKLARWNQVVAFRLIDPREESLPEAGILDLRDAETGERLVVDSGSPKVAKAYRDAADARREQFQNWCGLARMEAVDFPTQMDPLTPLLRFFSSRPRRRPR